MKCGGQASAFHKRHNITLPNVFGAPGNFCAGHPALLKLLKLNKCSVHIKTLQYYLKMGMKLTRVHRIIRFQQRAWLKPWIDFNTGKRKEAKSDFEKELYKLMNNSVYGKTMEDKRKHMDFELVDNDVRCEKCVNNPTFKNRFIINENLVRVEKNKSMLKLDKPIFFRNDYS